ncbi:HNH endonuclease [Mangrovactinospora gilvigrisea]|nr:HNH endonuclease signature motif containing protein [Mangrovactinospora gilvigrisea]
MDADRLTMTSGGRRPTVTSLNEVDPVGGLLGPDFDLVRSDRDVAAEVAASLVLRYFMPVPDSLLDAVGLDRLLGRRWADALRPLPGAVFADRAAVARDHGGARSGAICALADGLSIFDSRSTASGDGEGPGAGWIAYVGEGALGDQQLVGGNALLAQHQAAGRPLRYWRTTPEGGQVFDRWVVVAQRRVRWGRGSDGAWRRELVWILATVSSPMRESWPAVVRDAVDHGVECEDEAAGCRPEDLESVGSAEVGAARESYRRLQRAAERSVQLRGRDRRQVSVHRLVRGQAARAAAILRSGGRCESPACAGHPEERTSKGEPILQVDHVKDLALGGEDLPANMIALCPNCHALKTLGVHREQLRRVLEQTALTRHQEAVRDQTGSAAPAQRRG